MNTMKVAGKVYGFIVASLLGLPMVAALLVWLADGSARGRFDGAHIFSARYISSVVVFMVLLLPFFSMADCRTRGESLTWGEAMVAAVYVFGLLFWLYGVIPHEYLNWADSELSWRPDKKVIGPEGTWTWLSEGLWTSIPLTIHKQIFRDVIAVLLYAASPAATSRGIAWVGSTLPPPHSTLLLSWPPFSSTPSQPAAPPGTVSAQRPMYGFSAKAATALKAKMPAAPGPWYSPASWPAIRLQATWQPANAHPMCRSTWKRQQPTRHSRSCRTACDSRSSNEAWLPCSGAPTLN